MLFLIEFAAFVGLFCYGLQANPPWDPADLPENDPPVEEIEGDDSELGASEAEKFDV